MEDGRNCAHDLAVVVLSVYNQAELGDAVRSASDQDELVEIVVVNSGGGGSKKTLRDAGMQVEVIERAELLLPGAARNVGIKATRAPFVAFLAADCLAEPNWTAERLRAHRGGAAAVASAVTNAEPSSACAWAYQILMYARRMPGTPARERILYGLSYERTLFGRYGLFAEDLRAGEDAEFNSRLDGNVPIVWASGVRTAHRHPVGFARLLWEMGLRGARMVRTQRRMNGRSRWLIAAYAIWRLPRLLSISWKAVEPAEQRRMLLAWPLTPIGSMAYALGALLARKREYIPKR